MALADYPLHILKNPGAITASSSGLQIAPTLDGLGLTSADEFTPAQPLLGPWLEHATKPEVGASCGMITTYDVTAAAWMPRAEFVVRTPPSAELLRVRFWVGLFEARPDLLTSASVGTRLAAFYFEEAGGGSVPWSAVVSNGTQAPTIQPFTGNVSANTAYTMSIEIQASQVVFTLDSGGPPQTKIVGVVPGSSQFLGLGVRATTSVNASRSILWRRASWQPY